MTTAYFTPRPPAMVNPQAPHWPYPTGYSTGFTPLLTPAPFVITVYPSPFAPANYYPPPPLQPPYTAPVSKSRTGTVQKLMTDHSTNTTDSIQVRTENSTNGWDSTSDAPKQISRSRSPRRDVRRGKRSFRRDGKEGRSNPGNILHVSGLSHNIDSRELEAMFADIGRVKKASVMYDPHTRKSRGFGFVTMYTTEEAYAAVTVLDSTEIMGKVVTIEKARRGRARTPTPGRYHGTSKRAERPYGSRPYGSHYSRYDDRRRRVSDYDGHDQDCDHTNRHSDNY